VIYFCESVEVLYNLSLNYNESFGTTFRELLRVGRRRDMPASLKRSDKAVHLEGCGLCFMLRIAHYPKARLQKPEQNHFDTLFEASLSSGSGMQGVQIRPAK
jgi:hypothetical protein